MTRLLAAPAAVAALMTLAPAAPVPKGTPALEPLQGKWEVVEASERGEAVGPDKLKAFPPVAFEGDRMEMVFEARTTATWVVTVRPEKDPKEIDAVLRREGEPDKVVRGIYKFDGRTLTLALGLARDPARPARFESVGGRNPTLLMVLRKLE